MRETNVHGVREKTPLKRTGGGCACRMINGHSLYGSHMGAYMQAEKDLNPVVSFSSP